MDCWCACCGEFDCYGMDLCQSCGAPLDVYVSTPAPPTEWVLDAEVFGTARSDDGGTMHFVRSLKSAERLAALRSMPYPDYLETDEWFNVRMSALDASGWRCQVCNTDEELEVHHRTYDRRGEEVLEDVTVLCRGCHQRAHDTVELVPGGSAPPARRVRFVCRGSYETSAAA